MFHIRSHYLLNSWSYTFLPETSLACRVSAFVCALELWVVSNSYSQLGRLNHRQPLARIGRFLISKWTSLGLTTFVVKRPVRPRARTPIENHSKSWRVKWNVWAGPEKPSGSTLTPLFCISQERKLKLDEVWASCSNSEIKGKNFDCRKFLLIV